MNKNMILAYNEALEAMKKWDYPVWAVMFADNTTMIVGRNERNTKADNKSHAEINLIEIARNYVITDKVIYVTLEPCEMCIKALFDFWIDEIHYILEDPMKWWLKNITKSAIKVIQEYDDGKYLDLLLKTFEPQKEKFKDYFDYYSHKYL